MSNGAKLVALDESKIWCIWVAGRFIFDIMLVEEALGRVAQEIVVCDGRFSDLVTYSHE